ncbi:AP-2 complex subunit sigma [Acorus calamus]|uniref:AP-2 complex subunit sigma n=1 Tax=Acorus calamus TaxID=4465 RepID=A0AAV9D6E9_ACOCL|nr:AP-2 complex subunit sigma [Acorus calamus]
MNIGGLDIFVLDDEPINMEATVLDQDWTCTNGIIEVYLILVEYILAGELQETSKKAIIEQLGELEKLDEI